MAQTRVLVIDGPEAALTSVVTQLRSLPDIKVMHARTAKRMRYILLSEQKPTIAIVNNGADIVGRAYEAIGEHARANSTVGYAIQLQEHYDARVILCDPLAPDEKLEKLQKDFEGIFENVVSPRSVIKAVRYLLMNPCSRDCMEALIQLPQTGKEPA